MSSVAYTDDSEGTSEWGSASNAGDDSPRSSVSENMQQLSSRLRGIFNTSSSEGKGSNNAMVGNGGRVEDPNVAELLRHVRAVGDKVDRQLDAAGDLERKFQGALSDDESMASQHFHIDVGGEEQLGPRGDLRQRKVIYYPREKFPAKPRPKDVSGVVARTMQQAWFIQPYGYVWTLWSALIVLMCLYELLMVPIVIGWPFLGNPGMYVWDYVVDALFIFDMVLLFYVAQTPKTYYLTTDRQRNVLHYAWGWFMIDLAACVPIDLFVWAANGTQARDFARLLKLIHIFRLYRALHMLSSRVKERWNTYNEKWVLYNPNIERLAAMVLFIYIVCSVAGSLWIAYSVAAGFGSSFFTAPISLAGQSFGSQYFYAFYWTFYALFGTALLAHRPSTVGETFFSLALAVIGLCIFVGLISEVVNLLRVMDAHRSRWMEAQQKLNFSQKRKEVQQWLRAMLHAEPLFQGVEPAVIHSLAVRCKFKAYPKQVACVLEDVLPGAALFMIRKGVVEESRRGTHIGYLGRGATFNIKGLMQPAIPAGTSFHTVKHTEMFVLRRRDVLKVAQMFPKFAGILATRL